MSDTEVDAIVLAGGANSPEMRVKTGVSNRALVRLGDKTMLDYVVAALHDAPSVGRVFVVGDVPASNSYQAVMGARSLVDNLMAGIQAIGADKEGSDAPVLVATSDIPFLSPEAVQDFVKRARGLNADLCYPIVTLSLCRERFPDMKRTAVRMREGRFTGGNLMLLRPGAITAKRNTIARVYAARKSVVQLGKLLGWGLLTRIVCAQAVPPLLSLAMLEAGASHVLGASCRAVVSPYPEIGADVDKPGDVAIARKLLAP